jgi:hypothetical protein
LLISMRIYTHTLAGQKQPVKLLKTGKSPKKMAVVFGSVDAEVLRDAAPCDGTWFGAAMCQL